MRKYIVTVIVAFLIGLSLTFGLTATAATTGGSSADPLVAKSWVDSFVEQQFAGIKTQLADIKEQISNLRTEIVIYINKKDYTVNGVSRTMDTAAVINSDWRTMVPLRFVAEALGCTVDYSTNAAGSTEKVYINGASRIVLTIGSTSYTVDGASRTMDTAAVINSDWRTMVPVRFVAEALGCSVDYTTNAAGSTTAVYIRK